MLIRFQDENSRLALGIQMKGSVNFKRNGLQKLMMSAFQFINNVKQGDGSENRPCFEISECNEEKTSESSSHRGHKARRSRRLQGNTVSVPGGKEIALCVLPCVIYAQTLSQH